MTEAAGLLHARSPLRPTVGIVLGSGLGALADSLNNATRVPYADIPGLPISTAIGHKGELVLGTIGDTPIAAMSGRFHLYEGYSAQQVASGIRMFRAFGIRRVVLTNAAGGINLEYATGALVLISDHINLQCANPLIGPNDNRLGPRFPDMTDVYASALRIAAKKTADELGIALHEGVYAAMSGPSYETPAEIRFLRAIGADLVGMSTATEAIAANHMGMEVLGISCVTNLAAGLSGKKLQHAEVLEMGRRVSDTFQELLASLLPKLA